MKSFKFRWIFEWRDTQTILFNASQIQGNAIAISSKKSGPYRIAIYCTASSIIAMIIRAYVVGSRILLILSPVHTVLDARSPMPTRC